MKIIAKVSEVGINNQYQINLEDCYSQFSSHDNFENDIFENKSLKLKYDITYQSKDYSVHRHLFKAVLKLSNDVKYERLMLNITQI